MDRRSTQNVVDGKSCSSGPLPLLQRAPLGLPSWSASSARPSSWSRSSVWAELEAALARISRQDCSKLKGTEFDIVTRRLVRDGDMRYPLRSDERKVGIGATVQVVDY